MRIMNYEFNIGKFDIQSPKATSYGHDIRDVELHERKTVAFLFIVLFSLIGIVPSAHAQLATIEANATVYLPVIAGANTTLATNQVQKSITEIAFNALKKRIFDLMVDQIIDYINGNGQPQFITDWRGFFEQVGQIAIGDFVQQIGLSAICSPYRLQVQLAMIAPPRFSRQVTCTLGTIVRNVQNFQNDFRNGGWLAYQEMWAPNNNFYGTLLLAWNAKENEVAARLAAAGSEAMASQGFLSVKKCQKDQFGRDIPRTCVVTTPGVAVGALAQKAIGSDLDFIVNSQDLATYIAAISDALLNRLIRSGVEGLTGVRTPNLPARGNIGQGVGCDAFVGSAREDCLSYQNQYGGSYNQASKTTLEEIDAALQPRLQAQTILDGLIALEQRAVTAANTLYTCQLTKNQNTAETRTMLSQQQQQLDSYLNSKYQNESIIRELADAARNVGNSNQFGSLYLSRNAVNAPTAQRFLEQQQAEQARAQSLINGLANTLQGKINQCQSGQ